MRKLSFLFLFVLGLVFSINPPQPASADNYSPQFGTGMSFGTSTQTIGGVSGACFAAGVTSYNITPNLVIDCSGNVGVKSITCSGTPCGSGGGGGGSPAYVSVYPGQYFPGSGQAPLATSSGYHELGGIVPLGMVISHLFVTCQAFNATDVANGNSFYNALDSTGLGGGTISFAVVDATHPNTAPLVLGTVTIPDSPQAGPYIVNASAVVGTPYTAGTNASITTQETANVGPSQTVGVCVPLIGT